MVQVGIDPDLLYEKSAIVDHEGIGEEETETKKSTG